MTTPPPDRLVALAAIAGAHGVRGDVRLKLFAASLDSLRRHRSVLVGHRSMELVAVRESSNGPIVRLAGVGSREAAEALRGCLVEVARAELPPLAAGEVYWCDLVGRAVATPEGAPAGRVVAVENFGASDLLEIERVDGRRVLVPLTPEAVPELGNPLVIGPEWLEP